MGGGALFSPLLAWSFVTRLVSGDSDGSPDSRMESTVNGVHDGAVFARGSGLHAGRGEMPCIGCSLSLIPARAASGRSEAGPTRSRAAASCSSRSMASLMIFWISSDSWLSTYLASSVIIELDVEVLQEVDGGGNS